MAGTDPLSWAGNAGRSLVTVSLQNHAVKKGHRRKDMKKHVHGGNVYQYEGCLDFSANCNPLGTPEGVIEAAVRSLARIKDYPQVGYAPLREALAEYEGVKTDQVICGNGAAELIFSLCRAIRPGHAMLAVPSFAEI